MPKAPRAAFVALSTLLRRRFPDLEDPSALIRLGLVLVDDAPRSNPSTLVRADAAIRVLHRRPLRGTQKLSGGLAHLGVTVDGAAALDLGASAGGFTQALLDAGARRVYAVDVGVGQLRGSLRNDPRVRNLERTNLAMLDREAIDEPVDLVTVDLSYLRVADALAQLRGELFATDARLVALIKPTFELKSGTLAAGPHEVASALAVAREALEPTGWRHVRDVPSTVRGARGAIEAFLLAERR
ncbi:MAG TPA: SAM-dependent methyltransferase [Acidimicrobiales bacterium]|nr:SAM-dependent methyltransferase [Acidimicrobiales bacterium]